MMGFGVRDDWTLASLLAKKLTDAGHRVAVVNFGQPTYTATQAFIAFTEQLAAGNKGGAATFFATPLTPSSPGPCAGSRRWRR